MSDDRYRFEMHGRAFENGDRVDKLAAGLTALQHVFDGNYRAATGRKRISEQDRERFQIRVSRYEEGSFIAFLGAAYSGFQTSLPLFHDPQQLWDLTKSAYKFLKVVYELAHKKKASEITQDGNGNVLVVGDGVQITFNGPVYTVGTQIIGGLREFDDLLDDVDVTRISLHGPENDPILEMDSKDKGRFYPPTTIDETPVSLVCDVFDFNKYDNVGRAKVAAEQPIPPGNYRFKNIGDQSVEDFILSMTETQVRLSCLLKYEHDPLSETKIAEMLVLKVAA